MYAWFSDGFFTRKQLLHQTCNQPNYMSCCSFKVALQKIMQKLLKTFFSQPFFPWLVFLSPTTSTFTPLQSSYFRQLCAYLEMALVMNFSWKFLFAGWYAINPSISHIANFASSVANYGSFSLKKWYII